LYTKILNIEFDFFINRIISEINTAEIEDIYNFYGLFQESLDLYLKRKIFSRVICLMEANEDPSKVNGLCEVLNVVSNNYIINENTKLNDLLPYKKLLSFVNSNKDSMSVSNKIFCSNLLKFTGSSEEISESESELLDEILDNKNYINGKAYTILVSNLLNNYVLSISPEKKSDSESLLKNLRGDPADKKNPSYKFLENLNRYPLMINKSFEINDGHSKSILKLFSNPYFVELIKKFPVLSNDICYVYINSFIPDASFNEYISHYVYFLMISENFPIYHQYEFLKTCQRNVNNLYHFFGMFCELQPDDYLEVYSNHKAKFESYKKLSDSLSDNTNFIDDTANLEIYLIYFFKTIINDYLFLVLNIKRDPDNLFDFEREEMCKIYLEFLDLTCQCIKSFIKKDKYIQELKKKENSDDEEEEAIFEFEQDDEKVINHYQMIKSLKEFEMQIKYSKDICQKLKPLLNDLEANVLIKDS
jgi:hypothetical protein